MSGYVSQVSRSADRSQMEGDHGNATNCSQSNQYDGSAPQQRNIEKQLEASLSIESQRKLERIINDVEGLNVLEKLLLYLKLPSGALKQENSEVNTGNAHLREEQIIAINWIKSHLFEDNETALQKQGVYEEYSLFCEQNGHKNIGAVDLGKMMKAAFPNVKGRRLGIRGQSKHCYGGLSKKSSYEPASLPDIDLPEKQVIEHMEIPVEDTPNPANAAATTLVCEWAHKLLKESFTSVTQLAEYILDKGYVNDHTTAALTVLASSKQRDKENTPTPDILPKKENVTPTTPQHTNRPSSRCDAKSRLQRVLQEREQIKEQKRRLEEQRAENTGEPTPRSTPTTPVTPQPMLTASEYNTPSSKASTVSYSQAQKVILPKTTQSGQLQNGSLNGGQFVPPSQSSGSQPILLLSPSQNVPKPLFILSPVNTSGQNPAVLQGVVSLAQAGGKSDSTSAVPKVPLFSPHASLEGDNNATLASLLCDTSVNKSNAKSNNANVMDGAKCTTFLPVNSQVPQVSAASTETGSLLTSQSMQNVTAATLVKQLTMGNANMNDGNGNPQAETPSIATPDSNINITLQSPAKTNSIKSKHTPVKSKSKTVSTLLKEQRGAMNQMNEKLSYSKDRRPVAQLLKERRQKLQKPATSVKLNSPSPIDRAILSPSYSPKDRSHTPKIIKIEPKLLGMNDDSVSSTESALISPSHNVSMTTAFNNNIATFSEDKNNKDNLNRKRTISELIAMCHEKKKMSHGETTASDRFNNNNVVLKKLLQAPPSDMNINKVLESPTASQNTTVTTFEEDPDLADITPSIGNIMPLQVQDVSDKSLASSLIQDTFTFNKTTQNNACSIAFPTSAPITNGPSQYTDRNAHFNFHSLQNNNKCSSDSANTVDNSYKPQYQPATALLQTLSQLHQNTKLPLGFQPSVLNSSSSNTQPSPARGQSPASCLASPAISRRSTTSTPMSMMSPGQEASPEPCNAFTPIQGGTSLPNNLVSPIKPHATIPQGKVIQPNNTEQYSNMSGNHNIVSGKSRPTASNSMMPPLALAPRQQYTACSQNKRGKTQNGKSKRMRHHSAQSSLNILQQQHQQPCPTQFAFPAPQPLTDPTFNNVGSYQHQNGGYSLNNPPESPYSSEVQDILKQSLQPQQHQQQLNMNSVRSQSVPVHQFIRQNSEDGELFQNTLINRDYANLISGNTGDDIRSLLQEKLLQDDKNCAPRGLHDTETCNFGARKNLTELLELGDIGRNLSSRGDHMISGASIGEYGIMEDLVLGGQQTIEGQQKMMTYCTPIPTPPSSATSPNMNVDLQHHTATPVTGYGQINQAQLQVVNQKSMDTPTLDTPNSLDTIGSHESRDSLGDTLFSNIYDNNGDQANQHVATHDTQSLELLAWSH